MQPVYTQSVTVTIRAFPPQAERWEAAAAIHGYSVEGWLTDVADAAARELARSGRPAPLRWWWDYFVVSLMDRSVRPEERADFRVRGEVSGFFGIFRGDSDGRGEPGCCRHSLVHIPTRRIIDTLSLRKAAKALAAELAALRVNWQEKDPEKVVAGAPDQEKVQALLRLYKKLTSSVAGST